MKDSASRKLGILSRQEMSKGMRLGGHLLIPHLYL
jgi:hypothetical protein